MGTRTSDFGGLFSSLRKGLSGIVGSPRRDKLEGAPAEKQAKSEKPKPSRVEPDFYFINNSETGEAAEIAQDSQAVTAPNGPAVLVVEDNEDVLSLLSEVLTRQGYTVLSARRGDEALEIFSKYQNQIRVVITDDCIPKVSGRELLKRIHVTSPDTRFILTSGYYGDDSKPPVIDERISCFLEKPYQIGKLLQILKGYFEIHEGSEVH